MADTSLQRTRQRQKHDRTLPLPHSTSNKSKIGGSEAAEVREHGGDIAGIHAEPTRHGGEVLIAWRCRNPPASAGIVRPADRERREDAIRFVALNCAAHD